MCDIFLSTTYFANNHIFCYYSAPTKVFVCAILIKISLIVNKKTSQVQINSL